MEFTFKLQKSDELSSYLKLMGNLLGLSPREISIVTELKKFDDKKVTGESRRHARVKLKIDANNLNNYIKRLVAKKVLVPQGDPHSKKYHLLYHPLVNFRSRIVLNLTAADGNV